MPRIGVAFPVLALALSAKSSLADEYVSVGNPELCAMEGGVVGRRVCPPYGVWAAPLESPYLFITIGFHARRLPGITPTNVARGVEGGSSTPPAGATDTSFTAVERIAVATSPISYLGVEVEMSPAAAERVPPGVREFTAGGQFLLGVQGGTQTLRLGVELAAGGRFIETEAGVDATAEPVLEIRARGDLWITPWFNI